MPYYNNYAPDISVFCCLIATGIILFPICLIIGIPCLAVGLSNGDSMIFRVPLCPSGVPGTYVSQNLKLGESCPTGNLTAQAVTYSVSNLRSDTSYYLKVIRPNFAGSGANFTYTMEDQNTLVDEYGPTTLPLLKLNALGTNVIGTSYGNYTPNYSVNNPEVTIYDQTLSNCNNVKTGCSYSFVQQEGLDLINVEYQFDNPFNLIIDAFEFQIASAKKADVFVFFFERSGLGSLAITGVVFLVIPGLLIFSPCIYVFSFFSK